VALLGVSSDIAERTESLTLSEFSLGKSNFKGEIAVS
jgi:hypothetical protein